MKWTVILLLAVLACGVVCAQEAPDDPLLTQRRLAMVLRQATKHYDAGEYQAALDRLGVVQGPLARDLSVLNLQGAILTRMGQYLEARRVFDSILATQPGYYPAAYNLGEVQFLQGDYAGARDTFRQIRQNDPRNELVRFKEMLCLLKLGEEAEVQRLARTFRVGSGTPAWYYTQAILARREGDRARETRHLAAARRIYGEDGCNLFDQSIERITF